MFGVLIEAALDLDWEWMERGACHRWADLYDPPRATPWQISGEGEVDGIPAGKLIDWALIICAGCPVRYECARFAVEGLMKGGTWAMRLKLLLWLQTQPDALDVIDAAELHKAEVQVFVRKVQRDRTGS